MNKLQQTSWKINEKVAYTADQVLRHKVENFLQKLTISQSNGEYKIDYLGEFPEFDGGQLTEWMENLWFASKMINDEIPNSRFWHAYQFDWRGRLYTCSNLLSPQSDDLSRGLLLFGQGLALNNEGWKNLRRAIGRSYRGRELSTDTFTQSELETWSFMQSQYLHSKSWSDIDRLFSDIKAQELINKVATEVAKDPHGTFNIWGKDDVFRKKCEGFQRLNLTLEYAKAISEYNSGNKSPTVSIQFVVDASSNIYQHASRLIGDIEMARSVNVMPNAANRPADIYLEVADEVKRIIQSDKPFSRILNSDGRELSEEKLAKLEQFCSKRSTAKLPVMTIGYGSTNYSMIAQLLTHNGKDSGISKWITIDKNTGEQILSDDYYEIKEQYGDKISEFEARFRDRGQLTLNQN